MLTALSARLPGQRLGQVDPLLAQQKRFPLLGHGHLAVGSTVHPVQALAALRNETGIFLKANEFGLLAFLLDLE